MFAVSCILFLLVFVKSIGDGDGAGWENHLILMSLLAIGQSKNGVACLFVFVMSWLEITRSAWMATHIWRGWEKLGRQAGLGVVRVVRWEWSCFDG